MTLKKEQIQHSSSIEKLPVLHGLGALINIAVSYYGLYFSYYFIFFFVPQQI